MTVIEGNFFREKKNKTNNDDKIALQRENNNKKHIWRLKVNIQNILITFALMYLFYSFYKKKNKKNICLIFFVEFLKSLRTENKFFSLAHTHKRFAGGNSKNVWHILTQIHSLTGYLGLWPYMESIGMGQQNQKLKLNSKIQTEN